MNSVVLVGRLTRDIEVRFTEKEKAVSNFTIAVNRPYKNANGDYETDFINCVIFNQSADYMKSFANKGDIVSVKGSIQTRNYEDKDGNKRYITEVLVDRINLIARNEKKQSNEIPF